MSEETCLICGDLLNDQGDCYSCSPSTIESHKDFVFEYCHELDSFNATQFKRILPYYE